MTDVHDDLTGASDTRGLLEDALARGIDDWLHAAEFSAIARRAAAVGVEGLRALAIGLIAEALIDGAMVAGDVDDSGFHPWPEAPIDAITRVVRSWNREEPFPTPGSVAWFANTAKGDEIGRSVLDRETT